MSEGILQVVVGSIAAIITLLTGLLVLRQTQRHFRLTRSSEFIQRFNSNEFLESRIIVDTLQDQRALINAVLDGERSFDPEKVRTRAAILRFVNLFQELGGSYRANIVDRGHVWRMFGYLAQVYWTRFEPMIQELRRSRNRPQLYEDFQALAADMNRLDVKRNRARQMGVRFRRKL